MKAYVTILDGEDALLPYFVKHYCRLGATSFPVLVYGTSRDMDRAVKVIRGQGATPIELEVLPTSEFSAFKRESYIRHIHPEGQWAFFCDLDEFAQASRSQLEQFIAADVKYVGGLWLDRVGAGGKLIEIRQDRKLEEQFPCGATTRRVWKMDNNCYVLSPRAPSLHHPLACGWGKRYWKDVPKLVVHHFRWQCNLIERLRQRLLRIEAKGKQKSAWANRVRKTLRHIDRFDGVDVRLLHHVGQVLDI